MDQLWEVPPPIYNKAPIGLCHFDTDLRYRHINEWLAAIDGIPSGEYLGRTITEAFPSVMKGAEPQLRHVIETGEPIVRGLVHAEVPAEPGVTRTFEHRYHPVRSVDGTIVGVSCVVQDITERRRAEEELKNSEERLKILFEDAPDAISVSDLLGNFVDGNKASEEATGYKREELIGKNFLRLNLLPPLQVPRAAAALAKTALGLPTGPDEFTLNREDGGQVEVEVRTFPIRIRDQSLALGIARDITERKRAEEERKRHEEQLERSVVALEAANRELEMFNDALAHDLRNPLLTLTNFSEYLEKSLGDSLDEQQEDYLQRIRAAGRQMTHIIDDLLRPR